MKLVRDCEPITLDVSLSELIKELNIIWNKLSALGCKNIEVVTNDDYPGNHIIIYDRPMTEKEKNKDKKIREIKKFAKNREKQLEYEHYLDLKKKYEKERLG